MAIGLTISLANILIKCTGWVCFVYIGIIDILDFQIVDNCRKQVF